MLGLRAEQDGCFYASVCGAPTGRVHVFTISEADLEAVRALGFEPLTALRERCPR